MLDAVAKDGIPHAVKASRNSLTNLERLVGGAGEDMMIARVGQGIVSAIGSLSDKDAPEDPDRISKQALDSGLDHSMRSRSSRLISRIWALPDGGGKDIANVVDAGD